MRTDSARLAVALFLCALLAGCQSNWDWWRSSKKSGPSASALASAPPPYQPMLPSASAQPGAADAQYGAAGGPYSGVATYPNTGYPAGPGAGAPAGTTLTTTAGGSGYPLASRGATPAWPPAGVGTGATSPYPAVGGGLAQAGPATAQPASPYPSTTTPGGATAPQTGQYSGVYTAGPDTLAKSPAAAATATAGTRYAGDSSTGDRYASLPGGARYDATPTSPPDSRGAVSSDRYAMDPQRYNTAGSYNTGQQTGLPPTSAATGPAAAGAGLPPINRASQERYGSGTGTETKPGEDRYRTEDNLSQPGGAYQPSGAFQPGAGQPAATPPSASTGAAPTSPPGEYQPGSIKRYVPPTSATGTAGQYQSMYVPPGAAAPAQPAAAAAATYPPAESDRYYNEAPAPGGYPATATPAAGQYYR